MDNGTSNRGRHALTGALASLHCACLQGVLCWMCMPSACWRNAGLGYFLWVLADSLVCCLPLLGYFVLWGFGRLRALSAKDLAVTSRVPVIASGAGMLVGFAFHVAVATLFDVSEESRPGGSPFLAYLPVLVGWMAFVQSRFVPPAA